jgi:hypothetical protein
VTDSHSVIDLDTIAKAVNEDSHICAKFIASPDTKKRFLNHIKGPYINVYLVNGDVNMTMGQVTSKEPLTIQNPTILVEQFPCILICQYTILTLCNCAERGYLHILVYARIQKVSDPPQRRGDREWFGKVDE